MSANPQVRTQLLGLMTATGRFVRKSYLDDHAVTKADESSRQLRSDQGQLNARHLHGLIPPPYDPQRLVELLEQNTYHSIAVRTKARDVAGHSFEIQASSTADNPADVQRSLLVQWFEMLPMPITEIIKRAITDYDSIGWGAVECIRQDYAVDGLPLNLVHIPGHTLRVHKSNELYVQQRGHNRRVWFKKAGLQADVNKRNGSVHEPGTLAPSERASELIFMTDYSPRSSYYGIPPIIPALGAIVGDLSRRDYNITFFDNYGIPAYAVWITGDIDDSAAIDSTTGEPRKDGMTELELQLERQFAGLAENPHSIVTLMIPRRGGSESEVEVRFEKLSSEVRDASFRLYRQDNRDEVLTAHGVPPYRMGIAEVGALGQNVARETTEIYKHSIVKPRQTAIESLINLHVITHGFGITDWRFSLNEIDTVDENHLVNLMTQLVNHEAASPFELRRLFSERLGLNPDAIETFPGEQSSSTLESLEVVDGDPVSLADEGVTQGLQNNGNGHNLEVIEHLEDGPRVRAISPN